MLAGKREKSMISRTGTRTRFLKTCDFFLLINKRVWCVPCVIVFYKRPRNHIQMSGPEYEESEINEITKLTRRAHGTGSAVRARAILGQRDIRCSLRFPWAR